MEEELETQIPKNNVTNSEEFIVRDEEEIESRYFEGCNELNWRLWWSEMIEEIESNEEKMEKVRQEASKFKLNVCTLVKFLAVTVNMSYVSYEEFTANENWYRSFLEFLNETDLLAQLELTREVFFSASFNILLLWDNRLLIREEKRRKAQNEWYKRREQYENDRHRTHQIWEDRVERMRQWNQMVASDGFVVVDTKLQAKIVFKPYWTL